MGEIVAYSFLTLHTIIKACKAEMEQHSCKNNRNETAPCQLSQKLFTTITQSQKIMLKGSTTILKTHKMLPRDICET